jgi:hypothetical protein
MVRNEIDGGSETQTFLALTAAEVFFFAAGLGLPASCFFAGVVFLEAAVLVAADLVAAAFFGAALVVVFALGLAATALVVEVFFAAGLVADLEAGLEFCATRQR